MCVCARVRMRACGTPQSCRHQMATAAHIIAQIALRQNRRVLALTRLGDEAAQKFALRLGAIWARGTDEAVPEALDAAIVFAPDGSLVPLALRAVRKGGSVVCAGIHMSVSLRGFVLSWRPRGNHPAAYRAKLSCLEAWSAASAHGRSSQASYGQGCCGSNIGPSVGVEALSASISPATLSVTGCH